VEAQAAKTALQAQDYQQAEQIFWKLLASHPDSPELLNNLGIALHFQGKLLEAIEQFRRALRAKEMPGTLAFLSLDYCKVQEYEKAQVLLERTRRYYQDSNILVVVAPCYLETGDPLEGIQIYRELLRREIPPADEYAVGLGRVYLRASSRFTMRLKQVPGHGEYLRALQDAQSMTFADENGVSVRARSALATALREAPYAREGMSTEELLEIERNHREQPALLYLLAISCGEQAMQIYLNCEKHYPQSLFVRQWKAEMLTSRGRPNLAVAEYEALVTEAPSSPGLHNALGTLYGRDGNWEKALDQFRQELVLSPQDVSALQGTCVCLKHLGRFEEAGCYLQPLIVRKPAPKWALIQLANIEEDSGHLEKAIEYARRVLEQDPQDRKAHYLLSQLYRRTNRTDLAEREAAEFRRMQGAASQTKGLSLASPEP
jgi:tetratricopeptide (TPR) repeat protein